MKKMLQKVKDQKRDSSGKFTTGQNNILAKNNIKLSRFFPVIIAVALVGGFLVFRSLASPPSNASWKLTWSDEFNSTSLDTSKWTALKNSNYGSGNKQDECNRAENVTVSGGILRLTGKQETVQCGGKNPDGGNNTYYFTSGMVTTRAAEGQPVKFKYKHGYIEARIKSPKGNAYWPAFWLVGPNDGSTPGHPAYGEFDIYEGLGGRPDSTIGTGHFQCNDGTKNITCNTTGTNMYNFKTGSTENAKSDWGVLLDTQAKFDAHQGPSIFDYVNYGFEWDDKQIAWYVNGTKIRYMDSKGDMYARNKDGTFRFERNIAKTKAGANGTFNPSLSTVFNYDHSIILNLAIGGNMTRGERGGYTGNETATGYNQGNLSGSYPDSMLVDYVRVYKKDGDGTPPLPPSKLATPSGLKLAPADKSITASWTKSTDTRTNQYQVRYRAGSADWVTAPKTTSTSLTVSGLAQGTKYDFQVQALDSTGKNPASDYSATVQATVPVPQSAETGLRAAYFSKEGFRTKPVFRTDKTIDFNWGDGAPFAGHDTDFLVRWSGKIIAPVSGTYTITSRSDDGMNVWIGGSRIIESWQRQSATEKSTTIQLTAGQAYDIEVEYIDMAKGAVAQLFWQYPGQARQIVPTSALRPTSSIGLSARYYSANKTARVIDNTVNFNWGAGPVGSGMTVNNVWVNWVGTVRVPTTGEYTFITRSDDGISLSIDGNIIVDDWSDHSARERSGKVRLESGKEYALYVVYYEKTGSAVAQLMWTGPGIGKSIVPASALRSH